MIDEILQFIVENYKWLSILVLIAFNLILLLIVKRYKYSVYDNSLTACLLPLIVEAEKIFGSGNGQKKLDYVLNQFHERFKNNIPDVFLSQIVEKILSTPHKKG